MSSIDMAAIDAALSTINKGLDEGVVEAMGKVVITVDQAIVLSTPVDTGRARANWLPSINSPLNDYLIDAFDQSGGGAIGKATSLVSNIKPGDTFYISNNAPYIGALNDGHSKQAPAGFVEKAVQAARSALS